MAIQLDLRPPKEPVLDRVIGLEGLERGPGFGEPLNFAGGGQWIPELGLYRVFNERTGQYDYRNPAGNVVTMPPQPENVGSGPPLPEELNALSDDDLLALAGQFGIDTTPFVTTSPGLVDQIGRVPTFTSGLPTAALERANIPTNLPAARGIDALELAVNRPEVTLPEDVRREVAAIFQAQRGAGQEEIRRAAIEAAGRRGLNLTDTPIFEPLTRSIGRFESELRGGEAETLLSLAEAARQLQQRQTEAREQAIQTRFGLLSAQDRDRLTAELQRMALGEQARQFGGQFALNLADLRERARQGRFGLENEALLNRGQFLEGVRQFQQDFQNRLKQQAFQNRLSLGQNISQVGLGLNAARQGTPVSISTSQPPDLSVAFNLAGLGLEGIRQSGIF